MMNILAVGSHPDDLEITCYGTLIKYIRNGHRVVTVHITNGNLGHRDIMPDELGIIRNNEAHKAAQYIGAEAITLNISDFNVNSHDYNSLTEMVKIVRYVKPDLIITHNNQDYMMDHVEANALVFNASFAASVPHFHSEGEICPVCPIYYMDTLAGLDFIPAEYVDISDCIELKLEALSLHESQVKWMLDHDKIDFLEFVRACNRGRGCQCGVKYAEGFRLSHNYLRIPTKRLLP